MTISSIQTYELTFELPHFIPPLDYVVASVRVQYVAGDHGAESDCRCCTGFLRQYAVLNIDRLGRKPRYCDDCGCAGKLADLSIPHPPTSTGYVGWRNPSSFHWCVQRVDQGTTH